MSPKSLPNMEQMTNKTITPHRFPWAVQRLARLTALILAALTLACSAAAPTPAPTEPPPSAELAAASEQVFGRLVELLDELGNRQSATEQERRAAQRLQERFQALGYAAEIQPFTFHELEWLDVELAVASPRPPLLIAMPLDYPVVSARVSGPLAVVGPSGSAGLPVDGLTGKIALIAGEDVPRGDYQGRVAEVAAAGAGGALISIPLDDSYRPLRLPDGFAIPVLALDLDSREILDGLLAEGEVNLSLKIDAAPELESRNVVAELKGAGEDYVVVGAHYDIVRQTTIGANDNGSGTALVLALAQALAGRTLPFTVRFITFGSEELGLYGSNHYVASVSESELARIKAMLNFDVVGSGPHLEVWGRPELKALAVELAPAVGVELVTSGDSGQGLGSSSDHEPFHLAGKPVLMVAAADTSRIHTSQDTLDFIQPERLGGALLLAEALLRSPDFAQIVGIR